MAGKKKVKIVLAGEGLARKKSKNFLAGAGLARKNLVFRPEEFSPRPAIPRKRLSQEKTPGLKPNLI